MQTYSCPSCKFYISEADKLWDSAMDSGQCPYCQEPLRNFPGRTNRQKETFTAHQPKQQEERPVTQLPYPWKSVLSWVFLAFLLGLVTAHSPWKSATLIDRSASGVLVGIIYAVFTAAIVGSWKYFRRTPSSFFGATATTDFSAPSSSPLLSSNYFVRHWRGELSLGISYWLNSNLAGIASLVLITTVNMMEEGGYSLRAISFSSIGVLLFSVTASVWSLVGIWRSSNRHVARGGSSGWGSAARVGVVLGTIAMANQLFTAILPQVKEFALIASGNDPIGNIDIKVATNGQSVIVHGMLREGAAAEVRKILDAAPGVTSLVLNSAGGRTLEAKQLADIVQNRHLNTYVENQCASACTYVLLAGKDRASTPNARIGFHQPSFPGLDANDQRDITQAMLEVYRAAELPEAFIQRIAKTPPENMWYPTRDELIAAHVITRLSLGGEAAISGLGMRSRQELLLLFESNSLFQAIEKRFPGTTNKVAERGWAVKERGGTDADIQNTVRSIISEIYPAILKTADVAILDGYVKLMIIEMSAAQAIGGEACTMLLDGKLNIVQTLPRKIAEEEQRLLLLALARAPTTALTPPDSAQFTQVIQKVRVNLPHEYINVVDDLKAHASEPTLVCEAMLAFFRAIDALPPRERHVALRGMYQGED